MTTRIAITGSNSAVGQALLGRLAARTDLTAVAIVRRDGALAALPQAPSISPVVAPYDNPDTLRSALEGVGCVVHLAGILFEGKATSYQSGNVDTTRALVEAAKAAGVEHVIFISSLGADPASANGYFRSKGEAERLVTGSGIAGTVIRTPLLLGPETAGGKALVRTASQGSVKVLGGGEHTLRPLDVDDLCDAILTAASAANNDASGAATHDLVGPTAVTYAVLIKQMAAILGHDITVGATPIWLAKLGAGVAGLFRSGGMTPAVIDVITSGEEVPHNADGDLGVTLTPLEETLRKLNRS